jgi:hypothetical protein
MSPTLTQDRSPSPSARSTTDSTAFTLFLDAANANPTSINTSHVLTPPQTPDGSVFKETRKYTSDILRLIVAKRIPRGSLNFILN